MSESVGCVVGVGATISFIEDRVLPLGRGGLEAGTKDGASAVAARGRLPLYVVNERWFRTPWS